ncbi:MAG: serine/threonine-protein kinase [Polyangiales bacterium]
MNDRDELELSVGAVLKERYELRRRVGEGGMGTVFEAFDRLLERRVAVKVLRPEHASNAQISARFELEAKIASAFQHANVATTLDVGSHESGARFLVMEFLEGISLADAIARSGPLEDEAAVALVEPIARALAKAHQSGVIHRDVKPENIFLVAGERPGECVPKLVDFGIARRAQDSPLRLTATATIIGTPAYMPPEQARGSSDVTPSVDQYALAVVLYELLSSAHPHAAPSTAALLARKLTEPPVELRAVAPQVAVSLAAVVMRALESDPSKRFADINAFREALVGAVPKLGPAVLPPAHRTVISAPRVDSDARTEVATPDESPQRRDTPVTRVSTLDEDEHRAASVDDPAKLAPTEPSSSPSTARNPRSIAPWALAAVTLAALLALVAKRALSTRSIAVESSAVRVFELDAGAMATVEIRVEPRTASIKVDGVERGRGEARLSLAVGSSVEIALEAAGHVPRVEQHRVGSDERIERVLEPVAVAAATPAIADAAVQHRSIVTPTPRGHRPLQLGRTGFVLDTEIHQR